MDQKTDLADVSIRTDLDIQDADQLSIWATQPVKVIAGIMMAAGALVALLVAYGVPIDETQKVAILGVVSTVVAPIMAFLVIPRVFAPASAAAIEQRALMTGEQIVPADGTPAVDTAKVKNDVQVMAAAQGIGTVGTSSGKATAKISRRPRAPLIGGR